MGSDEVVTVAGTNLIKERAYVTSINTVDRTIDTSAFVAKREAFPRIEL